MAWRLYAWKLYFFALISVIVGGSLVLLVLEGSEQAIYPIADYIFSSLGAVQVAGLYGYMSKRPLLSERFWQLAFPAFALNLIAALVVAGVRFAANRADPDVGVAAATIFVSLFALPLFLPLLLANRWYAFRSPAIWKPNGRN